MTLNLIFFLILSLIAIATAIGMLMSRNAIYSALFLVLNFTTVAVFYLLLGAPFIAMAQITVMPAIMVLFLSSVLGADALPLGGYGNAISTVSGARCRTFILLTRRSAGMWSHLLRQTRGEPP
jgi:NADH:ubiquinone oxidoreductase subunit 6 (subunit J)